MKRKSTPRSRGGCSQCRAKKIKCDEAKPFCSRCVRSGWECSGYQPSVGSKSSNLFLTFAIAGKGPPSRTLPGFIPSVLRGSSSSRGDKGLLLLGRQRALPDIASRSQTLEPEDEYSTEDLSREVSHAILQSSRGIPMQTPGTDNEKLLLHYFRIEAAQDLSGYTTDTFWNNLVVLYSHEFPIVRSALLALSGFHRKRRIDGPSSVGRDHVVALRQYNKALRFVHNYLANNIRPSVETVLICCLLFYCIETLRGDDITAVRHVRAGIEIVKSWKPATAAAISKDLCPFTSQFAHLDVVFRTGTSAPRLVLTTTEERLGIEPFIQKPFPTISWATKMLLKLVNWARHLLDPERLSLYSSIENIPPALRHEFSFFADQYDAWGRSYAHLIIQQDSLPAQQWSEKASVLALYTSYILMKVEFYTIFAAFDPKWLSIDVDKSFETIIANAQTLINDMVSSNTPAAKGRSYLFHGGVSGALCYTACSSSDVSQKRRALELLKQWPIKEASFDAKNASRGIEKALKIATIPATPDYEESFDIKTFQTIIGPLVAEESMVHFNVAESMR